MLLLLTMERKCAAAVTVLFFANGVRFRAESLAAPLLRRFRCLPPASGAFILPRMSLKNATLLALIGTLLLTILLIAGFVSDVLNLSQGLIPATKVLSSLIHSFAALTVTVFFFLFHKAQS